MCGCCHGCSSNVSSSNTIISWVLGLNHTYHDNILFAEIRNAFNQIYGQCFGALSHKERLSALNVIYIPKPADKSLVW